MWGQKPGQPSKYGFCKQRKLLIFLFSRFFPVSVLGAYTLGTETSYISKAFLVLSLFTCV